jgi:hypothetical protein
MNETKIGFFWVLGALMVAGLFWYYTGNALSVLNYREMIEGNVMKISPYNKVVIACSFMLFITIIFSKLTFSKIKNAGIVAYPLSISMFIFPFLEVYYGVIRDFEFSTEYVILSIVLLFINILFSKLLVDFAIMKFTSIAEKRNWPYLISTYFHKDVC